MLTSEHGFYKKINDRIIFGYQNVREPGLILEGKKRQSYNFPVQGWYWFDSKEQATAFFSKDAE